MIADQYDIEKVELVIYTGNENEEEDVEIEILEMELQPATTKWVRQKADRKCLSPDPNDCLVWNLVEVSAVTEVYKIVIDTTQTDNYDIQKVELRKLARQGGFTAWETVLCPADITLNVINQVQDALRERGYYEDDGSNTLDGTTKAGLVAFQKDNGLPIGNLDMKTVNMLNINY